MKELNPAAKLLYDVNEVAELLGLGRSKLYSYVQSGQLRSIKVGRRRKVPADAVSEFIKSLEEDSASGGAW